MVTASDVACLLGKAPEYWDPTLRRRVQKTRADLVAEKRKGGEVFQGNRYTWWGNFMERRNAEAFAHLTGARIRLSGALLRSKATPLLGATLDGLVRAPRRSERLVHCLSEWGWSEDHLDTLDGLVGTLGTLEMKNTERSQLKEWHENKVPAHYWWQVQAQMYVTGLRWSFVVAKVGAADMRASLVMADEFAQAHIVDEVNAFWREVGK